MCGAGRQLSKAVQDQRRHDNKVAMKICGQNIIFGADEVGGEIDAAAADEKARRNAASRQSERW